MKTRPTYTQSNDWARIYSVAKKKGLRIQRNSFGGGVCICMPGGGCYTALSAKDAFSFVKDY